MEHFQTTFKDVRLQTECKFQTVVLIPKGKGGFRGIRLVEVLWEAFSGVINWRIEASVQFHSVLHDLQEGWGTGNTSLDAKLLQNQIEMR